MRSSLLTSVLLLAFAADAATQSVAIEPSRTSQTTFAIVVDTRTWALAEDALRNYRRAVQDDELGTWILAGDWSDPAQVRALLAERFAATPPLEGAVLIGRVPVPVLHGAQHLTSAYRLDEERAGLAAGVPSDRYYEDFELTFDDLGADPEKPWLRHLRLRPDSPQRVHKSIYTARILAADGSFEIGREQATSIARFLNRATSQRTRSRRLLHVLTVEGHGYHSESLDAWSDREQGLLDVLPQLARPGGRLWSLHHRAGELLVPRVVDRLRDDDVNLAIVHAHGGREEQLLAREPQARTVAAKVASLRADLRARLRRAVDGGADAAEALRDLAERNSVGPEWFDGWDDAELRAADEAAVAARELSLEEVGSVAPRCELMVLDQCFVGDFTAGPSIAGSYVFGAGRTLACVSNTVNVLQDVWADEFLGLLTYGTRVGTWHRHWPYLESTLFGDPTIAFAPIGGRALAGVTQSPNEPGDISVRSSAVNGPTSAIRDYFTWRMTRMLGLEVEPELIQALLSEASPTVRLRALACLAELRSDGLRAQLPLAAKDPSEFVRRSAARLIGAVGDPATVPTLVALAVDDPSERVSFEARQALERFDAGVVRRACDARLSRMGAGPLVEPLRERVRALFPRESATVAEALGELAAAVTETSDSSGRSDVDLLRTLRRLRTGLPHGAVGPLLELARAPERSDSVRAAALEVLGWYVQSTRRGEIALSCEALASDAEVPQVVRDEARKTVGRIDAGSNHPLLP